MNAAALPALALRSETVPVAAPDDLAAAQPDAAGLVWVRGGEGLVGWGEAARLELPGGGTRFERAQRWLVGLFGAADVRDEVGLPGTGPVAFGAFDFDPGAGGVLVVPRVVLGRRNGRAWLTTVGEVEPRLRDAGFRAGELPAQGSVRYVGSSLPELQWLEAVHTAVGQLRSGALEKVVLARDRLVACDRPFDARTLVRRLSERFPECFTFACDGLVGATPELLVRRFGDDVTSLVLAGSAPRSAAAEEDVALGAALAASAKDVREHQLAVRSVQVVLEDRCRDLHVEAQPHLLRLANVMHLATDLRARACDDDSALALAGRLQPTAAVGGSPTAAALALIRSLERMDRGRYAGPVGWVDARGDGEWGIALRCAELSGRRARIFAGAGVMADSRPEWELEETRLKLRAMQSAFQPARAGRGLPAAG